MDDATPPPLSQPPQPPPPPQSSNAYPPPREPEPRPAAQADSDRLGLLLAILLALTGLGGALIAWRLSDADLSASDAARAGLAATRERSRAVLTAEAEVTQSQAAWLRYELSHQRSESLRAAGQSIEALRAAKDAASHWAFVRSEFMRPDGTYDIAAHRRTTLNQLASGSDLDPARHFAAAVAHEERQYRLSLAGILIAGTLPFLALGTVTRRRVRQLAAAAGTLLFVASVVVMAMTWS